MKAQFTPGPWTFHNGSIWTKAPVDKQAQTNMVCSISAKWRMPDSEKEANARLITSAPELLQACKSLLRIHYDTGNPSAAGLEATNLAEAAIAKAEGKI